MLNGNHWHVLGAGSMGCLLASQLKTAGCPVTLLLREKPKTQSGFITVDTDGVSSQYEVELDHASSVRDITHLLVTTKAQDVEAAMRSVSAQLRESACVVFATNGMGYAEHVKTQLQGNPTYHVTSTEGAYRIGPLHICHAGHGLTRIGSADGLHAPEWLRDWHKSALECRWEENITAALWHKLAINCAINPLTAIHQCHNGELATDRKLAAQVKQLCDEIAKVSQAAGFNETAASIHADVATVIAGTADNRSSMLQDIIAGRETEIDFITGHLLRTAKRLGIDAPHNRKLFNQVVSHDH